LFFKVRLELRVFFVSRHFLELDSVFQILGEHLHAMPSLVFRDDCLCDMALPPRFKKNAFGGEVDPGLMFRKEPKNLLRNQISIRGTPRDRASLFAGTTKR
jgi:hypothetical protein